MVETEKLEDPLTFYGWSSASRLLQAGALSQVGRAT